MAHLTAPLVHENKDYDVTPTMAKLLCCARHMLHMDAEEVVLKRKDCVSSSEKRLPYGELGSVDQVTACGCCAGFRSNLSPNDPNNPSSKQVMQPGCGCSGDLVEEIVQELKARMKGRGDTGNIHRSEEAILRARYMNEKLELLLKHYNIPAPHRLVNPNDEAHKMETFPQQEYTVTNCCQTICCTKAVLHLEPEEVQIIVTTPCAKDVKRFPYGKLGDVASAKSCGCCAAVSSAEMGMVSPGCGCDEDMVNTIADELKRRMKARGDTGNIQRQEFANKLTMDAHNLLNEVLKNLGLQIPQPPEGLQAPQPQKMA